MRAQIHAIRDRFKEVDVRPGGIADFALGPTEEVGLEALADPRWSLYSLDIAREEAVFVELPPGADLAEAPFVGVMQFRSAVRAAVAPLAALETLASLAGPQPPPVLVYSMGRCGSTLLNAMLNASGALWSLSEPWAVDMILLGQAQLGRARAVALLRAAAAVLARPPAARRGQRLAMKFRASTLFSAPSLEEAFPGADNVFLYREAIGWAKSRQRLRGIIFRQIGAQPTGSAPVGAQPGGSPNYFRILGGGADVARLARIFGFDLDSATDAEVLAASWAAFLEGLDAMRMAGMKAFALRYDDLMRDRQALARLFAHLRAPPPSEAALEAILSADSQAGTSIARDASAEALSAAQIEDMLRTLARHPVYGAPDARLAEAP